MKATSTLVLVAFLLAAPAFAEEPGGTLNPEELTLNSTLERARRGETSMVICAQGYLLTKSGRHGEAREVFTRCAEAGYTGTMTWMSQMDGNGLGAPEDLEAAAEWNRRAALAGDPVGQFNHGLDLLRGHGVPRDVEAGRRFIQQAADAGLESARILQAADYDVTVVTPDADEWKYQQLW